ncbi:hypothetical protein [Trichloromonas sp.]|uniref:hypothetical protein n=1 Tax=Trichloromonas sp. TaxID=3069249 RepID=UPI002A456FF6|nr:hypothetical protein [Trichloromonas sp.]
MKDTLSTKTLWPKRIRPESSGLKPQVNDQFYPSTGSFQQISHQQKTPSFTFPAGSEKSPRKEARELQHSRKTTVTGREKSKTLHGYHGNSRATFDHHLGVYTEKKGINHG